MNKKSENSKRNKKIIRDCIELRVRCGWDFEELFVEYYRCHKYLSISLWEIILLPVLMDYVEQNIGGDEQHFGNFVDNIIQYEISFPHDHPDFHKAEKLFMDKFNKQYGTEWQQK